MRVLGAMGRSLHFTVRPGKPVEGLTRGVKAVMSLDLPASVHIPGLVVKSSEIETKPRHTSEIRSSFKNPSAATNLGASYLTKGYLKTKEILGQGARYFRLFASESPLLKCRMRSQCLLRILSFHLHGPRHWPPRRLSSGCFAP